MSINYSEDELNNEVWKPVANYNGMFSLAFEVSNLGRVKSLHRNNTKGRIIKLYVNPRNGYVYACLSYNNKKKSVRVHTLVMETFNPCAMKKNGYDKEWTIDHRDGNKKNNRLANLEWVTQSENQKRAFALGLNPVSGTKCINLDTHEIFDSYTRAAYSVGGKRGELVKRVCEGKRSHYRNAHFAKLSDYENNTIPCYQGKISRKASETLWH